MGNAAGLKALQVLANAERVLAIELLAGAQGVEFLAPLEPGAACVPRGRSCGPCPSGVREDRPLSADIERVASAVRDGRLVAAVEAEVGGRPDERTGRRSRQPYRAVRPLLHARGLARSVIARSSSPG